MKIFISGVAGSGKTYALSVRYIALLFLGAKPSSILTLTFTNKAAAEMKSRICEVLANLEDKSELNEIAKLVGISQKEILAKRVQKLRKENVKFQKEYFGLKDIEGDKWKKLFYFY